MKKTVVPSAERPARAVDKIRASASELFYREGIRAVGVDEVVDRAGVTKPSLYRSFASKDDLAAAYMRDYELDFWEKFEKPGGKSYCDAREHVLAYIRQLSASAVRKGYRGCGLSNATVEYPSRDNPARQVAEAHKKTLGRYFSFAIASLNRWVPFTRLSRILRFCSSVQRPPAMFSPAKLIIASKPSSLVASI